MPNYCDTQAGSLNTILMLRAGLEKTDGLKAHKYNMQTDLTSRLNGFFFLGIILQ